MKALIQFIVAGTAAVYITHVNHLSSLSAFLVGVACGTVAFLFTEFVL